ncbi:MAG: MFS transporter, partial [Roseiflexaceae bacterium]
MRISRHWWVAAAVASAIVISAGTRVAPGVFLPLLTNEFGWSRESLGLSVAIGLILYGLAGPFVGSLINRIGTRSTAVIGLVLIAVSAAIGTTVTNELQFAIWWGAVSGLGTGIVGGVLGAAVAMRWFVARRGLVQGIFGAATSAGQLLFVPVLALVGAASGWRVASMLLAVITVVLIIPVLFLVRTDPADVGITPYGGDAPPPNTTRAAVGVMPRALRPARRPKSRRDFFLR